MKEFIGSRHDGMDDFFLDISVKNFNGHFTSDAKAFGVKIQIMLKVPAWNLTTVRLIGSNWNITEFLRSLTLQLDSTWTEATVQMHVNAMKPVTADQKPMHWKNRGLMENRVST